MNTPADEPFSYELQERRTSDTDVPLDECLFDRGYVSRAPVERVLLDLETNPGPGRADVVGGAADIQLEVA